MAYINLSPPASSLIDSIRNIGYTFESAVADIVDNSLSYRSKNIDISVQMEDEICILISDDGTGMTYDQLMHAMALGGKGPSDERSKEDLGRFGLGLKLASFSQAKQLTVITKTYGDKNWFAIKWDLDHVIKSNKWEAEELSNKQILDFLVKHNLLNSLSGTHVYWSSCDRITQNFKNNNDFASYINQISFDLRTKLSLIFHKYLDEITLRINNERVKPMDPFCLKGGLNLSHSTIKFNELFNINNSEISVNGYLLPHISRMGGIERERQISIDADHTSSQGIYVYRLNRLISYGGWHGLLRKGEANKLARVEISINNDLDALWQLDVKKSSAILPISIRSRLKDLVRGLSLSSHNVFVGRKKLKKTSINSIWQRIYNNETNTISYEIDRTHPVIKNFIDKLEDKSNRINDLLYILEATLPVDLISNDLIIDNKSFSPPDALLSQKILDLASLVSSAGVSYSVFRETVFACGLFTNDLSILEKIVSQNKHLFKL